ncbi:tRNA-guanine transglycosylase [Pseudomonas aeruginosa]|nr:tRNA-guanine transglycosylase [Pseudomonas aeruginosa]
MSFMNFELLATDGKARRGRLTFPRGVVETPAFMPVGTYGTVKGMLPRDIEDIGAQIILGKHLPSSGCARHRGDPAPRRPARLHAVERARSSPIPAVSRCSAWEPCAKIKEEGVTFASPVDGAKVFMGPEESMAVQRALGSDIVMIFDECTPYPADHDVAKRSMELSLRWAKRSKIAHGDSPSALFGIVQGGMHEDLRLRSLGWLAGDRLRRPGHRWFVGGRAEGRDDPRARFSCRRRCRPTSRAT